MSNAQAVTPNVEPATGISEPAVSQSELVVVRAEFGAVDRWFDLTSRVQKSVTRNRLLMVVDSALIGGDPMFGSVKHLKLRYRLNGLEWEQWYSENNVVHIEPAIEVPSKLRGGLEIHEALYGRGICGETNWVDVANHLRKQVRRDHLNGLVSDLLQGIELPAAGGQRGLFLKYSVAGKLLTVLAEEREQISIGEPWSVSTPDRESTESESLSILDARYGANDKWINITDRLITATKSGRLFLVSDYHTFAADDPVPYVAKTFKLRFRLHGLLQERTYPEQSFVYFEAPKTGSANVSDEDLKILDAWYGCGVLGEKTWTEVTRGIKVNGSNLEVPISTIVRGAPASAAGPKFLLVRYSTKGSVFSICLPENGTLKIDASNH